MLRVTTNKASKNGHPVKRIQGVLAAAKALNVTYTHLSLVLHGHRPSRSLLRRYRKLKRAA
jgi:hypothetical protein